VEPLLTDFDYDFIKMFFGSISTKMFIFLIYFLPALLQESPMRNASPNDAMYDTRNKLSSTALASRLLNRRSSDPTLTGVFSLRVAQNVAGAIANWPFNGYIYAPEVYIEGAQPVIHLLDMYGSVQSEFCPLTGPCQQMTYAVSASIFNNPGCATLSGRTVVDSVQGVAAFTDLFIDVPESNYRLIFSVGHDVDSPIGWAPLQVITDPFDVAIGYIDLRWEIPDDFSPKAGTLLNPIFLSVLAFDRSFGSWFPLTTYDDTIEVSIVLPGCESRGGPNLICRNFAFDDRPGIIDGNMFPVQCASGNASITDLSIIVAGRHRLTFRSNGMRSQSQPFEIASSTATKIALVQEPPAVITAGTILSQMPVINVVDIYNNSISGQGYVVNAQVVMASGSIESLWTCTDPSCDFSNPFTGQGLDPLTAESKFSNLMIKASGDNMQINFVVTNIGDPGLAILPVRSAMFQVVPGVFVGVRIARSPQTERWVDVNQVPAGATAGTPFSQQPTVRVVVFCPHVRPFKF
jgi:hypothetical protein